jgi:glycosyltransferase involved in cell wall biosynthesis
MRVLYVIDSVVPAGAERSLLALAPHYVRHGIELEIAYLHDRPGLQEELTAAGARLRCVDGRFGRLGWLVRLVRLVRDRKPDLVHTTLFDADVVGRIAARLARTPVVSTLAVATYGPSHVSDPGLRRWKVRSAQFVDGCTARLARRLHAVATSVADEMAQRLHFPRQRIDVIARGREPEVLGRRTSERRASARRALAIDDFVPVLLAVGRQEHQKALDVLLAAVPAIRASHPTLRVLVAGRKGNQTPELERLIEQLGVADCVTLLGVRNDVADLMVAADVLVMPSRREGSPGALIEAMALELPSVVSDIAQIREVVGEDEARFVAVDSPESLAQGVLAMLDDPVDARERAERAYRTFCDHFTIGAVADRMMDFYRTAILPAAG